MIEIRFRKKGEEITRPILIDDIPEVLCPPEHLGGVDLTAYPIIHVTAGRHGDRKAQQTFERAGGRTVVFYEYSWRNGWGQGVLLPKNFSPSKVKFFKSAEVIEAEAEALQKAEQDGLVRQIEAAFPQVRVQPAWGDRGAEISPRQEVFADWRVVVSSVAEAERAIEENHERWAAWNERGLALYAAEGLRSPGVGNIQLHPRPSGQERVGIKLRPASEGKEWAIFARDEGGVWGDTGKRRRHAPR